MLGTIQDIFYILSYAFFTIVLLKQVWDDETDITYQISHNKYQKILPPFADKDVICHENNTWINSRLNKTSKRKDIMLCFKAHFFQN